MNLETPIEEAPVEKTIDVPVEEKPAPVDTKGGAVMPTSAAIALSALLGLGGIAAYVAKPDGSIKPTHEMTAREIVIPEHEDIKAAQKDSTGKIVKPADTTRVPRQVVWPQIVIPGAQGHIVFQPGQPDSAVVIVSYKRGDSTVILRTAFLPDSARCAEAGGVSMDLKLDCYNLNGVVTR